MINPVISTVSILVWIREAVASLATALNLAFGRTKGRATRGINTGEGIPGVSVFSLGQFGDPRLARKSSQTRAHTNNVLTLA